MNPLTKIYWIRVSLGITAGLISTCVAVISQSVTGTPIIQQMGDMSTLLNGITIALLVYLVSFYILKGKFSSQVEKPSKIMSMGIFIYFFSWLIAWVLTVSAIIGFM